MTINRILVALLLVFTGWIAVMALVMRFSDAAPAAVVPWPTQQFLHDLPPQAAILDVSGLAVTFANRPGLAQDLYAAGAWLVLPAGLMGCLPLSRRQREALSRR
ncbi:MAG: hypothetical protein LJE62_17390 [Silicimonas sp.]|jgi:heme/copper-type cytochrome/quinol oxidase subunit 3|nr:hypothetical protein [Silicimonas sp.]